MIMSHKKKKIALIGYRLSGGGSDKVMANLSIFFESQGFEVDLIIVLNEVSFPYSGKLVNLGLLKNKSNGIFNKAIRLWALRKYLNENKFDLIISFFVSNRKLMNKMKVKMIQQQVMMKMMKQYLRILIWNCHIMMIKMI